MRAIAINEFGGYDKLKLMDLPVPPIKGGEVLIQVKAAGVDNWNSLVRQNLRELGGEAKPFPIKLGWEWPGLIAEAKLAQLADKNLLTVNIQQVLPLEQAAQAQKLLESLHVLAKLYYSYRSKSNIPKLYRILLKIKPGSAKILCITTFKNT